jgi:transcriptional regulator
VDSQAIATWAEHEAGLKHTVDRSRLTASEIGLLYQLHKDGLTQVEIAQRLGCTQPTVSKWLARFVDSTAPAKEYLRGQALRMAQNIVETGRAADHIKALEGINVLAPEHAGGITVQIGVKADTVELIASTFASPTPTLSEGLHRLSAETGSDNTQLC